MQSLTLHANVKYKVWFFCNVLFERFFLVELRKYLFICIYKPKHGQVQDVILPCDYATAVTTYWAINNISELHLPSSDGFEHE